MKTAEALKKILAEAWTITVAIGGDCDYIFKVSFNNEPKAVQFMWSGHGTFYKCTNEFYREWKKYRDAYWGM